LNNCICKERGLLQPDWAPQMHGDVNALVAAGWDAVKIDSCGPSHDLVEWEALLNATGKAIQIENCHDNTEYPFVNATTGERVCPGHFFRVSSDINPSWDRITNNLQCSIKFNKLRNPVAGPGCWAYPDVSEAAVAAADGRMERALTTLPLPLSSLLLFARRVLRAVSNHPLEDARGRRLTYP